MAAKETIVANGSWRANSLLLSKLERKRGVPDTEWLGTCQTCCAVLPAGQLKLKRLGFNHGEKWVCAECLHPKREASDEGFAPGPLAAELLEKAFQETFLRMFHKSLDKRIRKAR
jgi:hypothetical protein